jgi:hypothetical protein
MGVVENMGAVGRVEEWRRPTRGAREMVPLRSTLTGGGRDFGAVVFARALARGRRH